MKALKLAAERFDLAGFQQAMLDFYRPQLATGASPTVLAWSPSGITTRIRAMAAAQKGAGILI
jgi:hypothetical protein